MIKPDLYKRTTDILYQAYFNDTLAHQDCGACAVGNICAGNGIPKIIGNSYAENNFYNNGAWAEAFTTGDNYQATWPDAITPGKEGYKENVAKVINATGYAWTELAKIEYTFEAADKGNNDEDWMFNGLVAVLEVLKDIHQVTDQDLLTANNNRFKEQYEKRTSCAV